MCGFDSDMRLYLKSCLVQLWSEARYQTHLYVLILEMELDLWYLWNDNCGSVSPRNTPWSSPNHPTLLPSSLMNSTSCTLCTLGKWLLGSSLLQKCGIFPKNSSFLKQKLTRKVWQFCVLILYFFNRKIFPPAYIHLLPRDSSVDKVSWNQNEI